MTDTLDTVRRLVGRRHKLSRQEMADILTALQRNGLDLRNGYVPRTVVYDGEDGMTGSPTDEQHPRAARVWANMCSGIICISVGGGLRDGNVRYDQPGSMNPSQYADVLFAPAELEHHEYDQIGQLRARAKRVLVVRDDPPLIDPPGEEIERKLAAWTRERNTCEESAIYAVDSRHARRLGLSVLSELERLRDELARAIHRPGGLLGVSAPELLARLEPIVSLARGDAQDRLTAEADEPVEIPGIVVHASTADEEW